jgi:steroid 5-alpha reductase family enzyme/tryptophan-rich sensory protein
MELLIAFIISIAIQIVMFIPAFIFQTDKLTDISYGISFIALTLFFFRNFSLPNVLIATMIILWGLRLSIFLFIRINKIKKDKRFDGMRDNFFKFLGFWLLQGVSVFAIMMSALLFLSSNTSRFSLIGMVIWGLGLLLESIADLQKYNFKNNPKNKGKFISSGIWKYSRHPNYFGEILCWVGIYIFAFPAFSIGHRIIALISPLFIVILLLFASGIPILEKKAHEKWGKDMKYIEYKKKTPILVPFQGLLLSISACLSAGFIGSFFTFTSIGSWYSTLNKPFFNPPNWLFGPVWTILYILMGISLYLAIKNHADKNAIVIFALQLALNALWSILFFGFQNPILALLEIFFLWIFILLTIIHFSRFSRLSGYLLIPYLLWVTFATILNYSIVALN